MSVLFTGDGRLEIHIDSKSFNGTLGGLCGNNNGVKYDDLQMTGGMFYASILYRSLLLIKLI